MKRFVTLNIGTIIALIAVFYIVYYLLVQDNFLHTSISSIIAHANHLKESNHLLVLGLLPIYIALMVFGAGILGVYLGSKLQYFLIRAIKKQFISEQKSIKKFATCSARDLPKIM